MTTLSTTDFRKRVRGPVCLFAFKRQRLCFCIDVHLWEIIRTHDTGKFANLIFIDFSKAFDRASASRILNQLIEMKATQQCILLISHLLINHTVSVKCKEKTSKQVTLNSGTPQGSLISPLLFAILCQSLQPKSKSIQYFKYADDLTLLHNITTPQSPNDISTEIDHILQWCNNNYMVINELKTKVLHIPLKKRPIPTIFSINNKTIECVKTCKLLGLNIEANLRWNLQVQKSISTCSKLFFCFVNLKRAHPNSSLLWQFFNSVVRPHLTYSCPTTCNMTQANFKKLQKVEKRFQILIGSPPTIPLPIFTEKICQKLVSQIASYEFHPLRNLLQSIPQLQLRTRSNRSFLMPKCKSSLRRNSFIKYYL